MKLSSQRRHEGRQHHRNLVEGTPLELPPPPPPTPPPPRTPNSQAPPPRHPLLLFFEPLLMYDSQIFFPLFCLFSWLINRFMFLSPAALEVGDNGTRGPPRLRHEPRAVTCHALALPDPITGRPRTSLCVIAVLLLLTDTLVPLSHSACGYWCSIPSVCFCD